MSFQFHKKRFTFTQPDGKKFEVIGSGDQHYAIFETLDGYTVTRNPITGFYQFAALTEDKDDLQPMGNRADSDDARALGLLPGLRINSSSAKAKGMEAFRGMTGSTRWQQRCNEKKLFAKASLMTAGPHMAPPQRGTTGTFVGLCILIDFEDDEASITRQQVDDFCNLQNYSEFGNNGSVRDYFRDNSKGQLTYTNIVTEYYRAANPKTHYTDPTIPQGTRARQLIKEALDDLKAQGFDFSPLTVDSRGYVYAMNVFYAGNVENNWGEGLWPHSWNLASEYDLGSGKQVFDYQFTAMESELSLGTFCHENGHMICDFPDLYDYGYQSRGVGHYCLMCAGGPDEKNPTQVSAYLKYKAGWEDTLTPVTHGAEISLSSQGNHFAIHRRNESEYFIMESRHKEGRDATLPSQGLAIWHVDEDGSNDDEQGTPGRHYELSLEQADNLLNLERNDNNGDQNDMFFHPNNTRFADSTAPGSKWWDGVASNLDVYNISAAQEEMVFKVKLRKDDDDPTVLKKSSNPNKDIPDRNSVGITDTLKFDQDILISSIKVTMDIEHTFIGDLVVTLHAPFAKSVILHRRYQGGSDANIKQSYDISSVPALHSLLGRSMKGDWTLQVQDLAADDIGVLKFWELEFQGGASTTVELEESPGTKIPDDDPAGIERTLKTNAAGAVGGIEVSVDITHSYIRDLIVTLMSPKGTSVALHDRTGGSDHDIVTTYTPSTVPDLATIMGEPVKGNWKLKISDNEGADKGKLNHWYLKIVPE